MSHGMLNFIRRVGQWSRHVYQLSTLVNVKYIFNPHTQLLLGKIDARFNCENCAPVERFFVVPYVMHLEPDEMSEPMNKIFAQRLAMQIFAARIDVIVSDFVQRVGSRPAYCRLTSLKCSDGGLLRTENHVINFSL